MVNSQKNSINYNMEAKTHKVVLFNDNKHDFLYVIACLIKFCKHEAHQAEQCTVIAHGKGSVDIASGSFMDMLEINTSLEQMDMLSKIEEYA